MPSTGDVATSIDDTSNRIEKLDLSEEDGRYIAGYANIANVVDNQDELITHEALVKAWEQFKQEPKYALLMFHHQNIPVAEVVFEDVYDSKGRLHRSGVDEKGLYLVAKIREKTTIANDVWRDIEKGKLRGFSIGGKNLEPKPIQCDEHRCFRILNKLELYEVSIVTKPANPASIFNIIKCEDTMDNTLQKLAKATEGFIEDIIREGIVKVSKKPDEDGVYQLYACTEKGTPLCRELSTYLASIPEIGSFKVVDTLDAEKEYVDILNLALLKPFSGALTRDVHVGSNASTVPDKPQKGENPELKTEENLENQKQETDNLEPETMEDEHMKLKNRIHQLQNMLTEMQKIANTEDTTQAIAPITVETLTANLAQVVELLEQNLAKSEAVKSMNTEPSNVDGIEEVKKEVSTEQDVKPPATETKVVPETEPTVTVEQLSQEPAQETPTQPEAETTIETPTETPTPAPAQTPVVEDTPTPQPQPTPEPKPQTATQPTQPTQPETPAPVTQQPAPQPAPQPQPVMQTRGVQVTVEQMNNPQGFNLASLLDVSQREIDKIREQTERRT